MKKILLFLFIVSLASCSEKENPTIDFEDDNVKLGDQIWMKKNLDVKVFKNGDPIFEARSNEDWIESYQSKTPAWCYYENRSENRVQYGILYNYYAIIDERELAPEGWRIPSATDWQNLVDELGGFIGLPDKLKSQTLWKNGGGNNSSGFNAVPAGVRYQSGFLGLGEVTSFWANTLEPEGNPEIADINGIDSPHQFYISNTELSLYPGLSVRCISE